MNNSRLAWHKTKRGCGGIEIQEKKKQERKSFASFSFLLLWQLRTNFDYHHIYYMIMFLLFFSTQPRKI